MKLSRFFSPAICLSLGMALISCSKNGSYDSDPVIDVSCTLTFNPEYIGTWATNQLAGNNTTTYGRFITQQVTNDSTVSVTYIDIPGIFLNANVNRNTPLTYVIAISTPKYKHSSLKPGTYTYTSTKAYLSPQTGCNIDVYLDGIGDTYRGVWGTVKASTSSFFSSYPDSYLSFTFTNVYKRKLKRGTVTFVDGSFDVMMLGGLTPFPYVSSGAFYEGQAHLTGTFTGFEMENY